MISDWTEEEESSQGPTLTSFSQKEQELLKGASSQQLKSYGKMDHAILEQIIIAYFIAPLNNKPPDTTHADKIIESGIKPEWFEDADYKFIFSELLRYYREHRSLLSPDDAIIMALSKGHTKTEAQMYKNMLQECLGALMTRKFRVELLIDRMVTHHLMKIQDEIYKKACAERSDPNIGPRKSFDNMRETCLKELIDPRGAVIKDYDFINDNGECVSWLKDMKHNPEKYRGAMCGINAFDSKTQGYRVGQLTVIVGGTGGYKTTTMLNIAYGLWENGHDVLYASLEMEAQIVRTKMLCRATRKISYSKVYSGQISEPEDDPQIKDRVLALKEELKTATTEQAQKIELELDRLCGRFDTYIAEKYYKQQKQQKKNKLVIINVGQSEKMKMSQLERWLNEKVNEFKPKVVILDYLDLIQPEVINPNRLDVGFGDICKMSRKMGQNMGFSVITAAQMKRSAVDRLRKNGMENPEKAAFGTDDISGSQQIANDADNVFVLWPKEGRTEIKVFTIKCRYGAQDNTGNSVMQVDHDTCTIADSDGSGIETTSVISNKMTMEDNHNHLRTGAKVSDVFGAEDLDFVQDTYSGGTDELDEEVKGGVAPDEKDKEFDDL